MNDETEIDRVIQRVEGLVERRRYDHARDELAQALARSPEEPELLFFSGLIDYLTDEYESAETVLGEVLAADPDHEGARSILHSVYAETGKFAKAERLIISLLRDFPQSAEYFTDYGSLMLKTLNFVKATELVQEAVRIDPEHQQAQVLQTLCKLIKGDKALRGDVAEMLRQNPESVQIMGMVILSLLDERRFEDALPMAQAMVRAYPDDQENVNLVIELQKWNHWLMTPVRPILKLGFVGNIFLMLAMLLGFFALRTSELQGWVAYAGAALVLFVMYCVFGPLLIGRWLRR